MIDYDALVKPFPFIPLVKKLGRIDESQRRIRQRFKSSIGRQHVAIGQDRLPIGQQPIHKQDGRVWMRRMAGKPNSLETSDLRGNYEPIDWGTLGLELLGFVTI